MTEKELARLRNATQHGLEEAYRMTLNRIAEDPPSTPFAGRITAVAGK